jgi:hypothetical protein
MLGRIASLVALVGVIALGFAVSGASEVKWRRAFAVGAIDGSCADLNRLPLRGFKDAFQKLGTPILANEWPQVQPGTDDIWAARQEYAFETRVPLKEKRGTYRFRIGFAGGHPIAPPVLKVNVANKVRLRYQVPNGDRRELIDGDALKTPSPSICEFLVPAEYFGDDSATLRIEPTSPSSWVFYDGIEVDWSPQRISQPEPVVAFDGLPSTLFIEHTQHGDVQRVALNVDLKGTAAPVELTVVDAAGNTCGKQLIDRSGDATRLYERVQLTALIPASDKEQKFELRVEGPEIKWTESLPLSPMRKVEVFVVPQAHFDNGYTDSQESTVKRNVDSLTRAIDYSAKYENFAWSNESAYILERWWDVASQQNQDRLIELVRENKIGLDAGWVNLLTGLPTGEGLYRWLYWSGQFAREHKLDLKTATLSDSPSHVWAIPQILASAGIEFLSIGSNADRSDFWRFGKEIMNEPFYWQGPDGSKVLTFVHRHYAQANTVGLTESLEKSEEQLKPWLLQMYGPQENGGGYRYNIVHLHGAYHDNVPLDERLPKVTQQWNEKYAWPRVILATNADFFEHFRSEVAEKAPIFSGDQGAYWEDGAASSAKETVLNRDAARRLALAEEFLAGQHAQGKLSNYPRQQIAEGWKMCLLYDEHTWGSADSIRKPDDLAVKAQFATKSEYAVQAHKIADELLDLAADSEPAARDPERKPHDSEKVAVDGVSLKSKFLEVSADENSGALASIRKVDDGREFIEQPASGRKLPHRFGHVVYFKKPRSSGKDWMADAPEIQSRFDECRAVGKHLESRYAHEDLGAYVVETYLSDDEPRVDMFVRFENKKAIYDVEGVYVAFPFAATNPRIDYEVGGAVIEAGKDWMPHACLDWFSVQDFVRFADPENKKSIIWSSPDAPLISLQDINTHKHLTSLPITNGRLYSFIMNNHWHTNYQATQGGPMEFRYSFVCGNDYSLSDAVSLSGRWTPEVSDALKQLVQCSSKSVRVMAFKLAEDGNGYILRLQDIDGRHGNVRVDLPALANRSISSVAYVNGVESPVPADTYEVEPMVVGDQAFVCHFHPFEIQTLRIIAQSAH